MPIIILHTYKCKRYTKSGWEFLVQLSIKACIQVPRSLGDWHQYDIEFQIKEHKKAFADNASIRQLYSINWQVSRGASGYVL